MLSLPRLPTQSSTCKHIKFQIQKVSTSAIDQMSKGVVFFQGCLSHHFPQENPSFPKTIIPMTKFPKFLHQCHKREERHILALQLQKQRNLKQITQASQRMHHNISKRASKIFGSGEASVCSTWCGRGFALFIKKAGTIGTERKGENHRG